MKTLGVIVPVFREEEVIELFHGRLTSALAALRSKYNTEIYYILDKSPDATEAKLEKIATDADGVHLLVLSRRFGHQAAIAAGIDHCHADAVIMLDGDLQHPPELIPAMVERFESGADIVQMIREDDKTLDPITRLTSNYFYRVVNRLSSMTIPSGAADFRLISARVADVLRNQMQESNQFFRGLVLWVGYNVSFIPFQCSAREKGRTKYNFFRRLSFAVNGICSFSKAPLRACMIAGIILALFSLTISVVQIVAYFVRDQEVTGWASLMLAISFATGIQLIFLGVISEYIALIFDEVKGRPNYLIERICSATVADKEQAGRS